MASARLRVLRTDLAEVMGQKAELLEGHKVREVRLRGVHKGTVVSRVLEQAPEGSLLFAAGDDRTDEDLFSALPEDGFSIRIGPGVTKARFRVSTPWDLRRLLGSLVS